ncbi:MAG TPA: hypothetical protein VHL80_14490 [Polyangia bacterium]|nr:hypothetical protein [Polyangia bacterium]
MGFVYTKSYPCEISVDRTKYCDAPAKAEAEKKVVAYLDVRSVRTVGLVESDKRPHGCFGELLSEHALILSPAIEATGKRYLNAEEVKSAELWDVLSSFCEELVGMARLTP